jgi:hypothetical protein
LSRDILKAFSARGALRGLLIAAGVFPALAGGHPAVRPPTTTNVCAQPAPSRGAPSAGASPGEPLSIDAGSHVVVMEYEGWFGPNAQSFQPEVTTCLQSADMQASAVGGGYDSADPIVVAQHVAWLELMGIDAVTVDLTNDVSCTFDGFDVATDDAFIETACGQSSLAATEEFRDSLQHIRSNSGNLFRAWAALGTRLKIIPMLGGFDPLALTPDPTDGIPALEKEIAYFGGLMQQFPLLTVRYQGKPLMLIYLGTPIGGIRLRAIEAFLSSSGLDAQYTFRLIGGYLESQPWFWLDPTMIPQGPIALNPEYGFWSVGDRLNSVGAEPSRYFPTYNQIASVGGGAEPSVVPGVGPPTGSARVVENMTASIATQGRKGWNCASDAGSYRYCPDAALRYCGEGYLNGCDAPKYETFSEFMGYARALAPVFLIIDQFNEFQPGDEGWDANTNDDVEPTLQWGYEAMQRVIAEVEEYRTSLAVSSTPATPRAAP